MVIHEEATTIATGMGRRAKLARRAASAPPPSAVFAVNDAMALGVMRAAREAGLRVPEDVAVIGFDDIDMAETADPPLTTVHIAKELMGELAARQLLEIDPYRATAASQEHCGDNSGYPGVLRLRREMKRR